MIDLDTETEIILNKIDMQLYINKLVIIYQNLGIFYYNYGDIYAGEWKDNLFDGYG